MPRDRIWKLQTWMVPPKILVSFSKFEPALNWDRFFWDSATWLKLFKFGLTPTNKSVNKLTQACLFSSQNRIFLKVMGFLMVLIKTMHWEQNI